MRPYFKRYNVIFSKNNYSNALWRLTNNENTTLRRLGPHPCAGDIQRDWGGEYRALFQQSDAMIHDSGSFILEYLLMDRPCMYLCREKAFFQFNDMNKDALKCYKLGMSEVDIERFIQEQVIGDLDFNAGRRKAFCEKYLIPPFGKSAAQNIIDAILCHQ